MGQKVILLVIVFVEILKLKITSFRLGNNFSRSVVLKLEHVYIILNIFEKLIFGVGEIKNNFKHHFGYNYYRNLTKTKSRICLSQDIYKCA